MKTSQIPEIADGETPQFVIATVDGDDADPKLRRVPPDLIGAVGPTGATGATGATGTDGADGADGADGQNLVLPTGIIALWYGLLSGIPAGWTLCDGSLGTPDLRERFVIGASQDDGLTPLADIPVLGLSSQGGSAYHNHVVNDPPHTHQIPTDFQVVQAPGSNSPLGGGNVQSSATGITLDDALSLPPFYALAYIMKL